MPKNSGDTPFLYFSTTDEAPPGVAVLRIRSTKEAEEYFKTRFPWLANQILPNAAVQFAREICFGPSEKDPLQVQPPANTGERLHILGQGEGKTRLSDVQESPRAQHLSQADAGGEASQLGEPGEASRLDTANDGRVADYTC
jgi:hypothetical protein